MLRIYRICAIFFFFTLSACLSNSSGDSSDLVLSSIGTEELLFGPKYYNPGLPGDVSDANFATTQSSFANWVLTSGDSGEQEFFDVADNSFPYKCGTSNAFCGSDAGGGLETEYRKQFGLSAIGTANAWKFLDKALNLDPDGAGPLNAGDVRSDDYASNLPSLVSDQSGILDTLIDNRTAGSISFTTTSSTQASPFDFIDGSTGDKIPGYKDPQNFGKGVTIAIVDTGVLNHATYSANIVSTVAEGRLAVFANETSTTAADTAGNAGFYRISPGSSTSSPDSLDRGVTHYNLNSSYADDAVAIGDAQYDSTSAPVAAGSSGTQVTFNATENVTGDASSSNVKGKNFISYEGKNDNDFTNNAGKDSGHGSMVASLAASSRDGDGVGANSIVGVAPEASILPVRVLNGSGTVGNSNDVARSIEWLSGTFTRSITGNGRNQGFADGYTVTNGNINTYDPDNVFYKYANKVNVTEVKFVDAAGNDTDSSGFIDSQTLGGNPIIKRIAVGTSGTIEEFVFEQKKTDIINLSLKTGDHNVFNADLFNVIVNAKNKDILIVAATGNDAADQPVMPAYFASHNYAKNGINSKGVDTSSSWINDPDFNTPGALIAVGSVTRQATSGFDSTNSGYELASYSNYCGDAAGYCLVAAGGDTGDTLPVADISNISNHTAVATSVSAGTSMAAPQVSGAAAVVKAAFPYLDMRSVARILLESATPMYDLDGSGNIIVSDLITITGGEISDIANVVVHSDGTAWDKNSSQRLLDTTDNMEEVYSKKYGRGLLNLYRAVAEPTGMLRVLVTATGEAVLVRDYLELADPSNPGSAQDYWRDFQIRVQSIALDGLETMHLTPVFGDALTSSNSPFVQSMSQVAFVDEVGRIFPKDLTPYIEKAAVGGYNMDSRLGMVPNDYNSFTTPEIMGTSMYFEMPDPQTMGLVNQNSAERYLTVDNSRNDLDELNLSGFAFDSQISDKSTMRLGFKRSAAFAQQKAGEMMNRTGFLYGFDVMANPVTNMMTGQYLMNSSSDDAMSLAFSHQLNKKLNFSFTSMNSQVQSYSRAMALDNVFDSEQAQDKAFISSLSYQMLPKTNLAFSYGSLKESVTFLGSESVSGIFDFSKGSDSQYYTASFAQKLPLGLELMGSFSHGNAQIDGDSASFIQNIRNVETRSYSVALLASNLQTPFLGSKYKSSMALGFIAPQVISAGEFDYVSTSGNLATGFAGSNIQTASLEPQGRERNIEFSYNLRTPGDLSLQANYLRRIEPYNNKDVPDEDVVMLNVGLSF